MYINLIRLSTPNNLDNEINFQVQNLHNTRKEKVKQKIFHSEEYLMQLSYAFFPFICSSSLNMLLYKTLRKETS